jgi:hypothetical protein
MLTIGGPSSQCRSETTAKKTGTTYKLNASVFQFAGPAGKDVVYRYCTDEGVQAYAQKDFSKAEDLFSAAVADAQKRKIQGPLLAMMLANLASAQREGKKLLQSRNTFRLAVAALSSSPPNLRSSINFTRALNYIAPQYAALLNKLHLESEAKFIEESPLTLLAAREDRDVLAGSVEKTEPTVPARTRIPARAEKREPVEEGAERTDLGSRSPFEDEKHAEPTIRNGGGGVTPSNVEQPAERVQERESITIRQTAFYWEPRNMYDALKAAVYYLGRGFDVTVMLDRMAVQVANRHDMKEVVEGDKLVPVKDILLEFLQKGGTVLVSQTWAGKLGYITGGNLPAGVKLLSDDEMRDEIFKRRRTLIDY